jgi:hypothetical protein
MRGAWRRNGRCETGTFWQLPCRHRQQYNGSYSCSAARQAPGHCHGALPPCKASPSLPRAARAQLADGLSTPTQGAHATWCSAQSNHLAHRPPRGAGCTTVALALVIFPCPSLAPCFSHPRLRSYCWSRTHAHTMRTPQDPLRHRGSCEDMANPQHASSRHSSAARAAAPRSSMHKGAPAPGGGGSGGGG